MLEPSAGAHALWRSVHMCTRMCVSVRVCLLGVHAQPGSCLAWAGELWQPDGHGTGKPHGEMPTHVPAVAPARALRVGAESDALFARGPERMELLFFLAALMLLGFRFVSKTALITRQHLSCC